MRRLTLIMIMIFQALLPALLPALLSGCGVNTPAAAETPPAAASENADAVNSAAVINPGAFTSSYVYKAEDTDAGWSADGAVTVSLEGKAAQISGGGASFADGVLTISRAGTYLLSGTLNGGQVLIDAGSDDVVRLVLNGASIHCETGPAIYAPQSEKVVLILADGSDNEISDGAGYDAGDSGDGPDAAIYVQDDLSVTGGGALTVTGNYRHGVRAQDILAITGGTLNITAEGDALRGRDGVAIQSGQLTLTAGGDGIQSNNDVDDAKGFVAISGGAHVIQSGSDGIQAQSALTVTGGSFQITTGGGSANAPEPADDFRNAFPGGRGGNTDVNRDGRRSTEAEPAAAEPVSMKALKAGKLLVIAGGDFIIDAEDDAAHSNGDLSVTAGKLEVSTGDDGFHADAALVISGGEINIPVCYEGIEGLSVTVSGGDIKIIAADDAVNAAGGADDASAFGGPTGGFGDRPFRDRFAASGDIFVRVSGGTLELLARHDGIDSNGDIFFEGGTVKISGPSQGMEGAIDLDGAMTVTGGELITAGSVLSVSEASTQAVILVSYSAEQPSGSVIEIKDAAGNTLLSYESRTSYSMSGFTSPEFCIGETYSLYSGGEKKTDILLSGTVTSISDDGGAYTGNGFSRGNNLARGGWGGEAPPNGEARPEPGMRPGADAAPSYDYTNIP
ncbi:MAG: carbohydrate-binding domain-containing protein [Oscillospiraceae bacterium]|nr:carbohydrate-binding domain-containing protein [Oscillospiraceae bacterium]